MESAIINGVLAMIFMILFLVFFAISLRIRAIADRYRIKYGFDKDIELKEIDNPLSLEERYKNFLRRTFRDMEEKK